MKNITRMSLKELLALDAAVHKQLVTTRATTSRKLGDQFRKQAASLGLRGEDFMVSGPITKVHLSPLSPLKSGDVKQIGNAVLKRYGKRGKVAIKYRDPNNRSQTWTGRGRMATWLSTAIKGGRKIDSFLIKK